MEGQGAVVDLWQPHDVPPRGRAGKSAARGALPASPGPVGALIFRVPRVAQSGNRCENLIGSGTERGAMKKITLGIIALSLSSSAVLAQNAGDATKGLQYWTSPLHQCRNCHGPQGEGQFGPDLAGRGLNGAQVYRAAHQPWGVMPAF